jgi:hypothetical protein
LLHNTRERALAEANGERLIGCIECNCWSWRGSDRLIMELPEEDLAALCGVKRSS